MASFSDLYPGIQPGNALGTMLPGLAAGYRIDRQPQYAMEDAGTQMTQIGRGFDRSMYGLKNAGAAKGQWGSSGLSTRADYLNQDAQDKQFGVQTNLARNLADVAQQRAMTFMGLY